MTRKRKLLLTLLAVLLVIYAPFVATRYTDNTWYVPFTGRVFRIDPDKVTCVRLQSGRSGEYIELDDVEAAVETLNSFRYSRWSPILQKRGGWPYRVILYFGDPDALKPASVSFVFDESHVTVKGTLTVCYTGREDTFAEWTARFA